jgi:precorrin-3B C17-methyltransferase
MTVQARTAIEGADVVIGNATYLDQIADLLTGKEVIRSSMGREVERAARAVHLARGRRVAMVSGGDAGVYGMASIVLEIIAKEADPPPVAIVPGVTAAQAAAAILGSPLSGDFVTLSLSDLLTPAEEVERRLHLAMAMQVPVVLYNPRSKTRRDGLPRAVAIALEHRDAATPVGIVRNAFRPAQGVTVSTLGDAPAWTEVVDMHTIVIIGGPESRIWRTRHGEGIVTPRGYNRKYLY